MALGKYYEDIVEAGRENGAAIVFEYQHPQENPTRVARVETSIEAAPYKLTFRDKIGLSVFVLKLESDTEHVSSELLRQTWNWSPAHFKGLGKISAKALARLAMAYRDEALKLEAKAPSFRAVASRKPVVFEIQKRRTGVLHLPRYAECY
jgi:hypothetical protein